MMTDFSYFSSKSTILVVDDTYSNLVLLSRFLSESYKVKIANSGEIALKIAQSDVQLDLILLDIMMPEMDGYEVCRILKANNRTKKIPIIFLTANMVDDNDEIKGFELGAVDYITKPISPLILMSRVKNHLKVKEMQDSLRDQREWFHSIVESTPDALLVIDEKGDIVLCNSRAAEVFGYGSSELYFKKINDLVRNNKGLKKDGSEFLAEVSFNNLPNLNINQGACTCVLVRDITENERVKNEILAAKELAEEANQMKSDFLANMSHELRTPLNAIIGYSEILQEDAADIGRFEFVTDLKRIHSAGIHLLQLINDILDLSKIEAGKMDVFLEKIDLNYLIQEVETIISPMMAKNNNQFVIEKKDLLFDAMHADVTKLKQTLFNLLANAAKFTHKGVITLKISNYIRGENEEERIIFSVCDTGIGLTEEQHGKLFCSFSQVDASTTRKYGGTGLGLAISQHFCQMMGGDISVRSVIGVGSIFTIDLPVVVVQNGEN
jgi:signal transduction histidine kinase